jgi:hypothetical protein
MTVSIRSERVRNHCLLTLGIPTESEKLEAALADRQVRL